MGALCSPFVVSLGGCSETSFIISNWLGKTGEVPLLTQTKLRLWVVRRHGLFRVKIKNSDSFQKQCPDSCDQESKKKKICGRDIKIMPQQAHV